MHAAGIVRCTGCGTCLRPRTLGILVIAGLLLSLTVCAIILYGFYQGEALVIESMRVRIALLVVGVVACVVFLGLGHGRRWGWLAMQALLALNLILAPYIFVKLSSAKFQQGIDGRDMMVALFVECVIAGAFWYYLRRPAVKAFFAAPSKD
jgi:hypothetical protein